MKKHVRAFPFALTVLLALAAAALLTGCLAKETTHTLYLDTDGSLTWTVLEKEIRSVADDPAERVAEEQEYLELFAREDHPVAAALRRLGGEISTRSLRAERPYATLTEARFENVAALGDTVAAALGVPGRAVLETIGHADGRVERRLRVVLELPEEEDDLLGDDDEILLALVEEPEAYRIVLAGDPSTTVRFTEARGFTLEADDVAVFEGLSDDELERRGGVLELELGWSVEGL